MAELDGPNRIHRRTLSRLNKLDAKLREWNTSRRARSDAKLRTRVRSLRSHRVTRVTTRLPRLRQRRPDYSSRRGRRALVRDAVRIVAAALGQRLAQQPLDLAVDAAQFLGRQRLDRGGDRRIEAQQERLSWWRLAQDAAALLVQRAGIDHGLRLGLGAQHDQQVRHHGRACARRRAPPRRAR